jgi:hypothetical protein
VLGPGGVGLAVHLPVHGGHHRHGLKRLDHGEGDHVGEADLAPLAAPQVPVEDAPVDLQQPRRHRPHRGRGRDFPAGLHRLDDPGRRPPQGDQVRFGLGLGLGLWPGLGLGRGLGLCLGLGLGLGRGSTARRCLRAPIREGSRPRRRLLGAVHSLGRGRGLPRRGVLRRRVLVALGLVLGEEVPPGGAHRLGVVQVLAVDLVDQPDVGPELRSFEPTHQSSPSPADARRSILPPCTNIKY